MPIDIGTFRTATPHELNRDALRCKLKDCLNSD